MRKLKDLFSLIRKGNEHDKDPPMKEQLQNTLKTVSHSAKKTDVSLQSNGKNLREEFLNLRLFETHPECKDVFFLFRDVEDLESLRTSRELRAHGLRIMSFIEKSVARLNQMERLDQLILDLGKSHYRYNAPPKYYSYVGAEFIRAVQPILKDNWTPQVEEAWKTLFLYITTIMKQGYLEEEQNQRNAMGNPNSERPEKRLNLI